MYATTDYALKSESMVNFDFELEPYGHSQTNESLEKIYQYIQSYKAGFDDRDYISSYLQD